MPVCLEQRLIFDCTGAFGCSRKVGLFPIDPQPATYTECNKVLATLPELSYFPQLTLLQGAQISLAIISVWAIGFGWRALKRAS